MYGFDDELDYDLFPAFEAEGMIDVEPDSITDRPSIGDKIKSGASAALTTIKRIGQEVWKKIQEFGAWLMNMARSIKDHLAEIFKKDTIGDGDAAENEKMMSLVAEASELVNRMGEDAYEALMTITANAHADGTEISDSEKNEAYKLFGRAMANKTEVTNMLSKVPHINASYKICKKAHEKVTALYGTNTKIGKTWTKLNSIREGASGDFLKMINQFTKVYNSLVNCSYALYNKLRSGFKKFRDDIGGANAYAEGDKISKKDYKSMTGSQVRSALGVGKAIANTKNGAAYAGSAGAEIGGDVIVGTIINSPIFKIAADKKGTAILKSMASYAEKNNISATELQQSWKRYVRQLHSQFMSPGSKINEKANNIAHKKNKPAAVVYATNAILAHANRSDFIKLLNEIPGSGPAVDPASEPTE